ncbi:MAG: FMN-binding protein [Lachnospiraceae bacterium]|nr:FMN-binding protein [Lachnospiraceae bacterium]
MVIARLAGTNAALRAKGEFTGATEEAITWQGDLDDDDTSTSSTEMVTGTYADGTYEGTGTGFNGDITVSVTITDGKISAIEVLDNAETENIGGVALPEYINQTIETQSLDIDVVSSASNTLRGYKEAVNDALSKAVQ